MHTDLDVSNVCLRDDDEVDRPILHRHSILVVDLVTTVPHTARLQATVQSGVFRVAVDLQAPAQGPAIREQRPCEG